MARARNIKPSIYKNEILGTLDPLLTILFTSLWCLADREGRLEDRPLRIKAETFPYRENLDVNGYLTVLAQHGFITRYKVGEIAIIQIVKFKEHQSPHNTEKPSVLPAQTLQAIENKEDLSLTVKQPLNNDGLTAALPPDSLLLIPDSFNLIPDSKKRESSAKAPPCPTDVDSQVWTDWLKLRKEKRAPVTETVVKSARQEAAIASMSFEEFLKIWCARGSQGLQASWLIDRGKPSANAPPVESNYAKTMREKYEIVAPLVAAKNPQKINPNTYFDNIGEKNAVARIG